jgi:gliding motility-associatede transport system auxiliary component
LNRNLVARVVGVLGLVLVASSVVTVFFGSARFLGGKLLLGLAALLSAFLLGGPGGAKRFFTGRAAHFGIFTTVSALLVAAILVAANYVAWARPKTWDLTREKIFTLAPDTVDTLHRLDRDVKAYAFYSTDERPTQTAKDLLERYRGESKRFDYQVVDPERSPELVKRFRVSPDSERIVLVAGDKEVRVRAPSEEGLTNGLVKLGRARVLKIYFTTGHGEPSPTDASGKAYSVAGKKLQDDGYEVATLPLLEKGEVPADATAVLVAGAQRPFLEREVKALQAWLVKGGKLGVYLEPEVNAGLDPVLKEFGIEADDDMVVDPSLGSRLFSGSPVTPIVAPSGEHPITAKLRNLAIALPTARSLVALTSSAVRPTPLLLTSSEAWGETDIKSLFGKGAKYDPGEKRGPLPVAMAAVRPGTGGAPEARLVVVGDSEFFDDRYQQIPGNLDFFLNGVAWLGEQPDRITVRPRAREASRLFLDEAQVAAIRFATVDAFPVALLAVGLAVWMVRRSR